MTRTENPMRGVYKRLSRMGVTRPFVRNTVLPTWWDDDAAVTSAGFAEALVLISRHVGVTIENLRGDAELAPCSDSVPTKLKRRARGGESDLALATAFVTQVARLATLGVETRARKPALADARAIRECILAGDPTAVTLPNLLDYCWSIGIPVIHISKFPGRAKAMDGIAASIDGRPVIVLCSKKKRPAWQLFILAHELGHIVSGHLGESGLLLDESVDPDSTDDEEIEANRFAIELLTGATDTAFSASGRWPDNVRLATIARDIGRSMQIDPGHVVLNYAHTMGRDFWPVANAALARLETPTGLSTIRAKMAEEIDWSMLPADSSEFFSRVTEARAP